MKAFKFFVVLSILFSPAVLHSSNIDAKYLARGASETIGTDYQVGDVAMTDPSICDFVIQNGRKEIYLNPIKEGVTTLTIWDSDGVRRDVVPITVGLAEIGEVLSEIKTIFGGNKKVAVLRMGDQIVIEGEASSPEEIARVEGLSKKFPQIIPRLKLGAKAIDKYCQQIESVIAIPGIRVRYIKGKLVLEGTAYNKDAYAKAENIAKLFEPNPLNLIEVREGNRHPGKEKLVQLDIYFMEVKRGALRTFGIQWAPGAIPKDKGEGDGFLSGVVGLGRSLVGFVFNLIPKIRFLRERGDARVLENPSFIVKSGEPVQFFSGTQVPYMSGDTVTFKDVGVGVEAEPIVAGSDVDIKITTNVSSMSAGVDKGIDTNKLATTAYLKAGQSLVLGGILRNNDAKQYNKVPSGLDTSSALFTLFLSKDYQSNQSEFLIFVTPTIVGEPENAGENLIDWYKMNEEISRSRSKKGQREYMSKKKDANATTPSIGIEVPEGLREKKSKRR